MTTEADPKAPPRWYASASLRQDIVSVRVRGRLLQLKAPWNAPLFSERNGGKQVLASFRGWRILRDKR